jgi:hypothetical protein
VADRITGIDFSTIPAGTTVTAGQKTAALLGICQAATNMVDKFCGQPVRATLNTEELTGPGFRVTVHPGFTRVMLSRWPVTNVTAVQVSPSSAFPRIWTAVTPAPGAYPEVPVLGVYGSNVPGAEVQGGQAVHIAPGWVTRQRGGWQVKITYNACWPHAGLTAAIGTVPTASLVVDDISGWAPFAAGLPGAVGVVYDGASQETFTCTAAAPASGTIQAGPGTLTASANLSFSHAAGIVVSALPSDAIEAAAFYAAADALTRGATSTTLRSLPGHQATGSGAAELRAEAELKLANFRRMI